VDGVVGNSSSGLIEVPSFKKGTINIGDRQRGRLRATSVIDCEPERRSIGNAIAYMFSNQFKSMLQVVDNPYGVGGASELVVEVLEQIKFDDFLKKKFNDLAVLD